MTWHAVKIPLRYEDIYIKRKEFIWDCRKWCMENLSSNGVLWKHSSDEPGIFYFAQPQDVIMFRLVHGV
jgi:hypothetical protein